MKRLVCLFLGHPSWLVPESAFLPSNALSDVHGRCSRCGQKWVRLGMQWQSHRVEAEERGLLPRERAAQP